MITLDAVTYRYPGASRPALRDVSLTIADGEVVGVVGANGSGKTTLCLVASGLAPAVTGGTLAGSVAVDGVDASSVPIHELIGHVVTGFQDPGTQLSGVAETVYEEVAFGPSNLGVPLAELLERTENALERMGITELGPRHPARLSGGQQQLVAIASLLAMRPRHLVLDEPTSRLDPHGAALVRDAIHGLARQGMAILLAEHRSELLAGTCSRVVALERGALALAGDTATVLDDPRLEALGVAPPPATRLRQLANEAGASSLLERALRAAGVA